MRPSTAGWKATSRRPATTLPPENVGDLPNPPFPFPEDEQLLKIIDETTARFREGEEPAAVAYAAALGWQAGRATAGECSGCAPEGHDNPVARALRGGTGRISFHIET